MLAAQTKYSNSLDFLENKALQLQSGDPIKNNPNHFENLQIQMGYLKDLIDRNIKFDKKEAFKVSASLNFSLSEAKYFFAIIDYENAKSEDERAFYLKELERADKRYRARTVSGDDFSIISDWYYSPILELTKVKDFDMQPEAIAAKLNISIQEARIAINQLLKLGLIEGSEGTYTKTRKVIQTNTDVPSLSIRKHHQQMMQLARFALEEQNVYEREISSMTIAINKSQISQIKKLISDFKSNLSEIINDENDKDKVYQLNIQFFDLTSGAGH